MRTYAWICLNRYRYIMVDEYQDTNRLQSEIVRLLAFTHDNVMAVGDDSQSIYSFRGANFRNIMDFPQLFPGARIIKLEENYRSTQPILDLTNTIIAEASEKYTKCLFTQKKEGPKPVLLQAGSENEQSRLICQSSPNCKTKGWLCGTRQCCSGRLITLLIWKSSCSGNRSPS